LLQQIKLETPSRDHDPCVNPTNEEISLQAIKYYFFPDTFAYGHKSGFFLFFKWLDSAIIREA
jgi:hypothetical protein